MTTATEVNPKVVTVYGRLSFPVWTAQEAYDRSQSSKFPAKSVGDAKPEYNLMLEEGQHKKVMNHIENIFLPYCVQQEVKGEKRDVLSAAEVKKLVEGLNGDLNDQTFNTPMKGVSDKTLALMPEAVSGLKVIGNAGVNLELKAIVRGEDELLVPDPDQLTWPVIKPIGQTVHQMYAGCYVAATLNLYAYMSGALPGFTASAGVAVFKADADRFGGGAALDEDEIFAD